jgi:hypothetical protein
MPEWDTKPSNHYLPRVTTASSCGCSSGSACGAASGAQPASLEAKLERGEIALAALAVQR